MSEPSKLAWNVKPGSHARHVLSPGGAQQLLPSLQPTHSAASQWRTGVTDGDGVCDADPVFDAVMLRVAVLERVIDDEIEMDRVCVTAAVCVDDTELEPVRDDDADADGEWDADGEYDDDGVVDSVTAAVYDADGVLEYDGETVGETVSTPSHGPPRQKMQSPASSTAQQLR